MVLNILTQSVVLFTLCLAIASLVSGSARCLSMALVMSGNYDSSELVYKISKPPTGISLISLWDFPYKYNEGKPLIDVKSKIAAVASAYGNNSPEMAEYSAFLAEEYLQEALRLNENHNVQSVSCFKASQFLSEKALQIYSSHKNHTRCSAALGVIAIDQVSLGNLSEARDSVIKALDLLAESEPSSRKDLAKADLQCVAQKIGDHALASKIKIAAAAKSNRVNYHKPKGFLDPTTIAIAMPILAMMFLVKCWERKIWTIIFRRKWLVELKRADDNISTLEALDKLTTLEFYLGRTQDADLYSKAMLKTASAINYIELPYSKIR